MTRVNTLKNHPWVFKRLYMGLIDELPTMLNFYSCKENATGKSFPRTALYDFLVSISGSDIFLSESLFACKNLSRVSFK